MKRILLLLIVLSVTSVYAGPKRFECNNSDVDTLEEICSVDLDYNYSECTYAFTVSTATLSDFDIAVTQATGSAITEYTGSSDYTSPTGFLYYASSDLTSAGTSGTHMLMLDHLSAIKTLTFSAAGTNSVVTGTVICNAL